MLKGRKSECVGKCALVFDPQVAWASIYSGANQTCVPETAITAVLGTQVWFYPRTSASTKSRRFAGRSAKRRIRYAYHWSPKGM